MLADWKVRRQLTQGTKPSCFLAESSQGCRFAQALACRLPKSDITGKQVDSDSRFPPATGQGVPRPLSVIP
jgi:hypothetical protein